MTTLVVGAPKTKNQKILLMFSIVKK